MNKTEQTTSPIFYDPTPANSPQLRQWAKDSMSLVLQDPARKKHSGYFFRPGMMHVAPEWEVHVQLFELTPWDVVRNCNSPTNTRWFLKGVEVAEDMLIDRVHRNMKP